ncbi:Cyclic nucleotide-binding domain [Phytophthora infestans]|uniref:Cyclic nucleotide-binding domain n=1 Tax=Phytophthora infestans TaxID=4787 RepID=A0A8S9TSP7_PHYIN|nr:Cyclic nucleotide-binding domain [Phytophthora infestans]
MAALPSVAPKSPTASKATTAYQRRRSRHSRLSRRTTAAWAANREETGSSTSQLEASKWSALRLEILPNPALMTVSAKAQRIIDMLKKPPEDRSENDILPPCYCHYVSTPVQLLHVSLTNYFFGSAHVKILYQWLMNQEKLSSLFTTMSEVSAKKLCKEMEFLHLNSGEVVVKQGEKGSTCFILMSGLVSVYVRSPEEQIKHQRLVRSNSISSSMLSAGASINYGNKVVTLTPGATFGELCLIEPDSKRSATVVVDQQAQMANFIVLTAASYLRNYYRQHRLLAAFAYFQKLEQDAYVHAVNLVCYRSLTRKCAGVFDLHVELMHIVNSMKFVNVSAGQYLARKGGEADSFFVFLRGEAIESVSLTVSENSEMSMGEVRGVHRSITVELTFLGKFDVAGEYIESEKKISFCPVDIRATTDVDCLVLTRKLFMLHFGGKELKPHVVPTRRRLRMIAVAREAWRETRILQALQYPTLRFPITRKLMRLSGNCCLICGRHTHIAGDPLCMELPSYFMLDEKQKKREQKERGRTASNHRLSVVSPPSSGMDGSSPARTPTMTTSPHQIDLPSLRENDHEDHNDLRSPIRVGVQLVSRQWQEAEKNRVIRLPQRPEVGT